MGTKSTLHYGIVLTLWDPGSGMCLSAIEPHKLIGIGTIRSVSLSEWIWPCWKKCSIVMAQRFPILRKILSISVDFHLPANIGPSATCLPPCMPA